LNKIYAVTWCERILSGQDTALALLTFTFETAQNMEKISTVVILQGFFFITCLSNYNTLFRNSYWSRCDNCHV